MNLFKNLLYRLKILPITETQIKSWEKEMKGVELLFAAKYADAKLRFSAIQSLGKLGFIDKKIKNALIALLTDDNLRIALEAKKVLEQKLMPTELDDEPAYESGLNAIKDKKAYLESISEYYKKTKNIPRDRHRGRRRQSPLPRSPYGS